jgi:hypothetical protein
LIFEFGFIYNFIAILSVFVYICFKLMATNQILVIFVILLVVSSIFFEIWSFRRSAYGRAIVIDANAQSLG